jgi:hypothetical protein
MASNHTVKSLQKQFIELQNQIREISWKSSAAEEVKRDYNEKNIIYVHKDRKIPKFSDRNIPVEDWIEDVRTILYSRDITRQERADLIYSNLEGSAKDEVKYRSHLVRSSPEQILETLQEAFGVKDNITKQDEL